MITTEVTAQSPAISAPRNSAQTAPSSTFSQLLNAQTKAYSEEDEKQQMLASEAKKAEEKAAQSANLREELNRLVSMTPEQLVRFQMLEEMNLTEESLKELPFEERMKVEGLIKEAIERQIAGKKGIADAVTNFLS